MEQSLTQTKRFHEGVTARFGVLPNFFCTASTVPGLIEELWGFAKSAYLDSPMPSLFKERLFVHLSRFCPVRYCIVRHVGFLTGEGRPSGDAAAVPESVEAVVKLLRRPLPDGQALSATLERLTACAEMEDLPGSGTTAEGDLFDALTIIFVEPRLSEQARDAVRKAVGEARFEILTAFLAFIRTAHYWTETHPELAYEADMAAMLGRHRDLSQLLLDPTDAEQVRNGLALKEALNALQETRDALGERDGQLAVELRNTRLLHELAMRRFDAEHMPELYDEILRVALVLMRADGGIIEITDGSAYELRICASTGFSSQFIEHFRTVGAGSYTSYGDALAKSQRSFIDFDVPANEDPEGSLRKHKEEGYSSARSTPLITRSGRAVGVISTHWRKQFRPGDRELRMLDLLAWQAADIIEDLRAGKALMEVDRRKDEFLATLSHELRTPLAPMRSGIELLRGAGADRPDPQLLDLVERQLAKMVRLIDDLMDVSRINSGKLQLRRENVPLARIIEETLESTRSSIVDAGHSLSVHSSEAGILLNADRVRLVQVLSNLIHNATKYTKGGGIISLTTEVQGAQVTIEVADNGMGIPASAQAGLFDMFSQVTPSSLASQGGLGIGLNLVKRLTDLHGGTVSVYSAGIDQGSRFTVRLPVVVGTMEDGPPQTRSKRDTQEVIRHRVLVVDDSVDGAATLALILERSGHITRIAHDGESALVIAEEFEPQVVLLDIGLPHMNGYAVAQALRQRPKGKEMLLVALTGWGQEEDKRKAFAAGFDRHIVKPVDPQMIAEVMTEVPIAG